MKERNCLILTQYRNEGQYNDFIGKFYHFPATEKKSYLKQFENLPIEIVYYEPDKKGSGEFYGYGIIKKPPFEDKREIGYYFVEISEYKPFAKPVFFKNDKGQILEKLFNTKYYNYNNAVRRITPELLDALCLDGRIQLNFKADAHLIKVLGEQLIGSEKVGILELVKNAIDAGASYCRVRIEKIKGIAPVDADEYEFGDFDGPVIVIEDDGAGMNREIIENGWLRPASTIKTNVKEKLKEERRRAEASGKLGAYNTLIDQLKRENKGRIPLGEKGVGRFATHRLGRNLIIKSKPIDSTYEYVLKINWDSFDEVSDVTIDLDSIGVELTRQVPSRDYGTTGSGTQIIVYGGREGFEWDEKKIRDINKSILRLNSPNPNPSKIKTSFRAFVDCPQIPDLDDKEVFESFTPNFSLEALVSRSGVLEEYTLKFSPPKSVPLTEETWTDKNYDLKASSPYWRDENGNIRNPVCGGFYIHLDSWYRRAPWIDGPDAGEMKKYLDEYGGISIYRDDIIIFPAESGTKNDWLDLSKRHIKQGFRISYYNIIGNIEIEQSENMDLVDKTNREGMIENLAFNDLSVLAETIIQNILETRYIAKRDEYTDLTKGLIRDPKALSSIAKQNGLILDGIQKNYPIEEDPWRILHQLGETVDERKGGLVNIDSSIRNLKKSIDLIEEVQERMAEHAGFGIAAAVSIHEITKITANFYNGISQLLKTGQADRIQLEDLKSTSASLKSELKRLSPLRAIRNENRREFNIVQSVKYAQGVFSRKMKQEGIEFEFDLNDDFQVYARYSTLNQILGNLFDNSIYWILASGKKPRKIKVDINSNHRTLIFSDTGTGVDGAMKPYLFQPGYSMKIPPSGLGLYICKAYMHSMGGDIHETTNRERLPNFEGAQFTIEFDRVPESKEQA
ncbi:MULTISPECIES: sensor histidine kinase [unclassified Leeuwenhoekiella]|uniref:sensor histidine kinase n=1 Tax=unclassified Leeuwenhoekiella TaxID=2615029 RepID=UPI000C686652|nr:MULTISPECIES: sensor histidine kinase [unclassified Leeuwenhoekiella]MAW96163.1 ATP-binding protein [Leeuwenhoekiella sp.]MBA80157.1 ATP-binding protein [Leeuwenhoekiella sp.]|tara:strand:- start:13514 stop:16231 length:2718 start_codon:yes stop_codon:yes gene_type:complete